MRHIINKRNKNLVWFTLSSIAREKLGVARGEDVGSVISAFCAAVSKRPTVPVIHWRNMDGGIILVLPTVKSPPGKPLINAFVEWHCVLGARRTVLCDDFNAALAQFAREEGAEFVAPEWSKQLSRAVLPRALRTVKGRKAPYYIGVSLSTTGQQYLKRNATAEQQREERK